jgi:hypothetical protein
VDRDERVQTGSPAAVDDYVLVIEGLRVALVPRRDFRARRAHCGGVDEPLAAVPVEDPVPVDEVPVVEPVPVDEVPVEGGWAEAGVVLVPGWVLDVEPPGVLPAGVVLVVPGLVVPSVEVGVEESSGRVLPPPGSLRPAPPVVVPAEIPPVDNGGRLPLIVVVEVDSFVLAAVDSVLGTDSPTAGANCPWVGVIAIDVWVAVASEAEDALALGRAGGLEVGRAAAART